MGALSAAALLSVTLSVKLGVHPMIVGTLVFSVTALLMNTLLIWRNKVCHGLQLLPILD